MGRYRVDRVGHGPPWPTQNFGWVGHNAFGLTNNWPVCSLILRKISKIGATRCQVRLKNPDQIRFPLRLRPRLRWGSLRRSTDLYLHLTGLLLRRERGKGGEGKEEGKERQRSRKGRRGGGGIWPTQKFWSDAPMTITAVVQHQTDWILDCRHLRLFDCSPQDVIQMTWRASAAGESMQPTSVNRLSTNTCVRLTSFAS